MKSYTDIEQSKKLAEILPLESADMSFVEKGNAKRTWYDAENRRITTKYEKKYYFPCWSLAALRACLPSGISIKGILYVFESHNTFDNEWVYEYKYEDNAAIYIKSKNEIDACVEIIIKLNKQNNNERRIKVLYRLC